MTSPSWISLMRAPDVADLLDQVVVARPVEDDRRHVVDAAAERVRDRLDVLADRPQQVDVAARARPDRDLAHVHVGQRRQLAGARRRRSSTSRRCLRARRRRVPRAGRARGRRRAAGADDRRPAASPPLSSIEPMTTRPLIGSESRSRASPRGRFLRRLLVGAAEPARAASAARSVAREIRLAQARPRGGAPRGRSDRLDRRSRARSARSARRETSSDTAPIARSASSFSTTGDTVRVGALDE